MKYIKKLIQSDEIYREILSGFTVALTLTPETVAFSLVVGSTPSQALLTTVICCFITTLFGGRKAMISGAAGALAVVSRDLVKSHSLEYLYLAVLFTGLIEFFISQLKIGKLLRACPTSVVKGFCSGLALLISRTQLESFYELEGSLLLNHIFLVLLGLIIIKLSDHFITIIPPALFCIVLLTIFANFSGFSEFILFVQVPKVQVSMFDTLFPHIPDVPLTFETFKIILPYSFILSSIALVETVLTQQLVDDRTATHGDRDKEIFAQGLSNIIGSFFKSQGGCSMLVPSSLNIQSGGREKLSGFCCAFVIFSSMLFANLFSYVPVAALISVLLDICFHTFAFESFLRIYQMPKIDAVTMVGVCLVTLLFNLAAGVMFGIIIAALNATKNYSGEFRIIKNTYVDPEILSPSLSPRLSTSNSISNNMNNINNSNNNISTTITKVKINCKLIGPLFWASCPQLWDDMEAIVLEMKTKNDIINIDLQSCKILDDTAIENLKKFQTIYRQKGIIIEFGLMDPSTKQQLLQGGIEVSV